MEIGNNVYVVYQNDLEPHYSYVGPAVIARNNHTANNDLTRLMVEIPGKNGYFYFESKYVFTGNMKPCSISISEPGNI